jgi:hypothetical protein
MGVDDTSAGGRRRTLAGCQRIGRDEPRPAPLNTHKIDNRVNP